MRLAIGCIAAIALWGGLGLAVSAQVPPVLSNPDVKVQGHAVIRIIRANEDGEVVGESVMSPLFAFRRESGPSVEGVQQCEQSTETRTTGSLDYPVVVLRCKGTMLVLVGVDMTTGQ